MKLLIAIAFITVLLALYVVWLRPWMRNTTWGKNLLSYIEPMERMLWWKSESLLWSRFKIFLGTTLTVLVGIDWNSVSPIFPEKYRPILVALPTLFVALDGLMGEPLRRDISKPLELVAMRTDAPPEVKAAAAEVAKKSKEVVEAVKEAEAV